VPYGYFLTVVLIAVCTIAALFAPRKPFWVGRLSFLFGLVVSEIPQIVGLFLVLSTVLAFVEGNLVGVSGAAAVTVATAILLGLTVVAWRAVRSRDVVLGSLRDAGLHASPAGWRANWQSLIAPLPIKPGSVRRTANLRYGAHRRQRLDVYRRSDTESGPLLVYLHGGGYFSGGKHREARALLYRLAARGWVCISADYRLRPGAGFPDHLADARSAVAWAHSHASEFGGDPSTLVMAGGSAGAHLTALCALDQQGDVAGGENGTRIDAAVCLYGYYGRYYGRGPQEHPVSTPLMLDATQAPPFFIAHGAYDGYVPVASARALVDHLRAQSPSPVAYAELPYAQHAFDLFYSWRSAAVTDGVEAFLDRVLSTKEVSSCAS